MRKLLEARRTETDRLAPHDAAARIRDDGFQRHALERLRPVRGPHHQAELHLVAGPVDAAVREHVRGELARLRGVHHAAHVEARVVEAAVAAVDRQEGRVVAIAHQVHRGLALAHQVPQRGQRRAPAAVGRTLCHGAAVAADHLHHGARHGFAAGDRLHEDILGAVDRLLDQDAEVGDEHQPLVARADVLPRLGIPATGAHQEHAAALAARRGQVGREIEAVVLHRTALRGGHRGDLHGTLGQVVVREAPGVEVRVGEAAAGLRRQQVQPLGQHARDLVADRRHVARIQRQAALAAQRQQRARVQQLHLARRIGHEQRGIVALAQLEAAEGLQAPLHLDVEVTARRSLETERVQRRTLGARLDGLERQRLGQREDFVRDQRGRVPLEGLLTPLDRRVRVMHGQQPGLEVPGKLRRHHVFAGLQRQQLFALEPLVGRIGDGGLADREAEPPGDLHRRLQRLLQRGPAEGGHHAGAEAHLDLGRLLGHLERLRMQVGLQPCLVVAGLEGQRRPAVAEQATGTARAAQAEVLLEAARVHRMREAQRHHDLLELRIDRVLVELGALDAGREGRRAELEVALSHGEPRAQQACRLQPDVVLPADRPVGGRLEAQRGFVGPAPASLDGRRELHARLDRLADVFDGRRGFAEHQQQRRGSRLRVVQVAGGGGRDRDGHGGRPRPGLPPPGAAANGSDQRHQRQHTGIRPPTLARVDPPGQRRCGGGCSGR